ncbi:MAG TPA: penicillin acylase family protein [Pyrinomonadaceae bacterium]|nr:penicillin acylase family protein [Pyrinomonadaceae bacterium]
MKAVGPIARLVLSLSLLLTSFLPLVPAQTAAPQAEAPVVSLPGLKKAVKVRRDERGVPYVEAEDELDLYFAQGYVTASDRLFQMDLFRRSARGELSEIFGKLTLEEDKRRRNYGFARVADAAAAQADPRSRAVMEAYAAGVNAYIDSLDDKSLPPEFRMLGYRPRHWTPADTGSVVKNFAEALSTTWTLDLARALFAGLPPDKAAALFPEHSPLDVLVVGTDKTDRKGLKPAGRTSALPLQSNLKELLSELSSVQQTEERTRARIGLNAEDLAASNNWVVSGKRTASGKPLLANDPHLPSSAPSIWHMIHLSAPGLRVAGVTAAGAPGVIIGHNERIAWGLTNLGPDVQDLYRETFDPQNPRRYQTASGWRDAEVRREEIKVRKALVGTETEVVPHEVTVTRHGPVIFRKGADAYALRWTALTPEATEFTTFYKLNRARNWKEFADALKDYGGATQNFVYADVDGHIGYYGAGLIPIRSSGDGSMPYDGAKDEGEWKGFIPHAELPHVYDPPSGIIVTANSRVVGRDYPHFLTRVWASPTRSRRIYDLLTAKQKLTVEDFRAVQADAYTISGATFAREVARVAREAGLDKQGEKWRETVKLFESWDGQLEPDARAPRLAVEMAGAFRQKILAGALGADLAKEYRWPTSAIFFDRVIQERPREWLPKEFASYAELLDAAHRETRESLTKSLGADETKWTWGARLSVNFPHPLKDVPLVGKMYQIAPFPQRGGGGGIFAAPNVGSSVSMRLIADASDWDRTRQGIALGVSGDPRSPHWRDQLEDWRAVTPRVFPFTAAAVARSARHTLTLAPK